MIAQLNFTESRYIGVFSSASDSYCICGIRSQKKVIDEIEDTLKTEFIYTTIGGISITGSLLAINSNGIAVPDIVLDSEIKVLNELGLKIGVIDEKYNTIGNNILVNDGVAIVHPMYSDRTIKVLEDTFGVEVLKANIAGLENLGMCGFLTNKGLICHPKIFPHEIENLESIFKDRNMAIEIGIGTVNHGREFIGAGLVGNSNGVLISKETTTVEISRIEDILGV